MGPILSDLRSDLTPRVKSKKEFLVWLKSIDDSYHALWQEYCMRQTPISFYEYLLLCTEQEEIEKRISPD